jgi:hypothetical protein
VYIWSEIRPLFVHTVSLLGTISDVGSVCNLYASNGYCLTFADFTVCVLTLNSNQHCHWNSSWPGAASNWMNGTNCASSTRHYLTHITVYSLVASACCCLARGHYNFCAGTYHCLEFAWWYWVLFDMQLLFFLTVCVPVPGITWCLITTDNLYADTFSAVVFNP